MSAPGDDSTPAQFEQVHAVLPSIIFLLMFQSFLILFGMSLGLASESVPAESHHSITESTTPAATFPFPTVYFQRDSMKLDRQAKDSLKPLIDYLKSHPEVRIRLNGHVDERRTQAYGLVLSGKWADIVKHYLRAQGVTNPIDTSGYSKDRPVCLEHNEACWRVSNRVEVVEKK